MYLILIVPGAGSGTPVRCYSNEPLAQPGRPHLSGTMPSSGLEPAGIFRTAVTAATAVPHQQLYVTILRCTRHRRRQGTRRRQVVASLYSTQGMDTARRTAKTTPGWLGNVLSPRWIQHDLPMPCAALVFAFDDRILAGNVARPFHFSGRPVGHAVSKAACSSHRSKSDMPNAAPHPASAPSCEPQRTGERAAVRRQPRMARLQACPPPRSISRSNPATCGTPLSRSRQAVAGEQEKPWKRS